MRSSIHATGEEQPFPPTGYTTPRWPSLFWPPLEDRYVLYHLDDMWRFTLIWTFVMYACFHWAAIGIALIVQIGKKKTNWKYLWTVPIIYSAIAAVEALVAGSVTGAMSVVPPCHTATPPTFCGQLLITTFSTQGWCHLQSRGVVHDDVDSIHLGLGQCVCAGRLVLLLLRRPMRATNGPRILESRLLRHPLQPAPRRPRPWRSPGRRPRSS